MNPQFSIYLDLVRILVAFTVFFSHLVIVGNPLLWRFNVFPGHLGVIVFFVLSGYVIAYVVFERKEHFNKFIVNRFTSIYSVVIPAMVITYLSYWYLQQNNPVLFMLHRSWQQVNFLTNNPIWSVAFEMFYYIAFAVLVYTNGVKLISLFFCVALMMGPNVLIYFPLWLLGVYSFFIATRWIMSLKLSFILSFLPILGIISLFVPGVETWFGEISKNLVNNYIGKLLNPQSQNIAHDYACALLLSVHFMGIFNFLRFKSIFPSRLGEIIRSGAEMTFALYLLHLPFLCAVSAIFIPSSNSLLHAATSLLLLPIFIFVISKFIEARKATYYSIFSLIVANATHFSKKVRTSK